MTHQPLARSPAPGRAVPKTDTGTPERTRHFTNVTNLRMETSFLLHVHTHKGAMHCIHEKRKKMECPRTESPNSKPRSASEGGKWCPVE